MFSFICMIISLSDLFSMCKIQKNPYFQTRPERLIMIQIKEDSQGDIKVIGLWKEVYGNRFSNRSEVHTRQEDTNLT